MECMGKGKAYIYEKGKLILSDFCEVIGRPSESCASSDFVTEAWSKEYKHACSLVVISMLVVGGSVEDIDTHPLFG